ncbi:MAG TPA: L,D-transpeptidase [Polyangiales bacterium]|nr:L,D-transpeptidase [Polyangiales bacterium]
MLRESSAKELRKGYVRPLLPLALGLLCCWLGGPVRAGSPERPRDTTALSAAEGGEANVLGPASDPGSGGLAPWNDPERSSTDPLADYPLYGVASYFAAQVYSAPDERGLVAGYLRRGTLVRAKRGVPGKGCETEWHALFGGGFACAGRGFALGEEPLSFPAAPSVAVWDALPYPYAKARDRDIALYSRAPLPDDELQAKARIDEAHKSGKPPLLAAQLRALAVARAAALKAAKKPARGQPPLPPLPPLPLALPEAVRMLLQPGFYLSIDPREPPSESGFVRTVRGDFVRLSDEVRVVASTWHGDVLPQALRGEVALVAQPKAVSYRRNVLSGELVQAEALRPLEALQLEPEPLVRKGRRYRVALDGRVVSEDALRFLPVTERPKLIPSKARWISISLERQTLVAYEGARPVFATLVSTGKAGHDTPSGVFRIQSKHVSTTMDGEAAGDEDAYSIEDVPYVMYFSGSVALHAAFWHEKFGKVRSHGCVNLTPLDARWLFHWASPILPAGFHGVVADAQRPGTFVSVAP